MSYCQQCGNAIAEGARFCGSCGTAAAGQSVTPWAIAMPTLSPATVVIIEPKRGGMLAVKGFLLALALGVIGAISLSSNKSGSSEILIWDGAAFALGATYIILSLRKWKRQGENVKGETLAWIVVVILIISAFGGFGAAGTGSSRTSVTNESTSIPAPELSPKDALMRDVKLDFKGQKEGFGDVLTVDFTVHNPTQLRFKDFEVTCTHFAPSGTAIDSNTRTVYEIVQPKSTKHIYDFNMGFIATQSVSTSCKITDLVPVP